MKGKNKIALQMNVLWDVEKSDESNPTLIKEAPHTVPLIFKHSGTLILLNFVFNIA